MSEETHSETPISGNASQSTTLNVEKLVKTVISPQSQLITVHLNEDNYLLWKLQVETALQGYGLEGFIQGTLSIPPKCITTKKTR